jgi:hypothetical protein
LRSVQGVELHFTTEDFDVLDSHSSTTKSSVVNAFIRPQKIYIRSGAEIPSSPSPFAIVSFTAFASARRACVTSGASPRT